MSYSTKRITTSRQPFEESGQRRVDIERPDRSALSDEHQGPSRFLGVILFCLPTLAAFGPYIPGFGPLFAFRLAAFLLLAMALLSRGGGGRKSSRMRAPTILLVAVWTLVSAVGLMRPDLPPQVWSELLSLAAGLCLILAFVLLPSPRASLLTFSKGWLLSYVLVSVFAVREVITGVSLSSSVALRPAFGEWGVAVSFFNPNNYATYLLYSFFALGFVCMQQTGRVLKFAAIVSLASLPVFMLQSNSRTGFWVLTGLAVVGVFIALRKRPLLLTGFVFIFLSGLMALVGFTESNPIEEVVRYIGAAGYSVNVLGLQVPLDQSTYVRWQLVGAGLALVATSPLFGGGPGSFEFYVADTGLANQTLGILSPHNGFIEVASQYGIVVTVLFVIWFVRMLRIGFRSRSVTMSHSSVGWILLLLGVLTLPFIVTMHSSMIEPSTTWVFLGFLLLLARAEEPVDVESGADSERLPRT